MFTHTTYMATNTQNFVAKTPMWASMKHVTAFAQVHVQPQPDTNNRRSPYKESTPKINIIS